PVLHAFPTRRSSDLFLSFLRREAPGADALYILGDLFEYWIGDDDPDPYYAGIKSALAEVAVAGVPLFFMHGNRDFLIGERFAAEDRKSTRLNSSHVK